MEVFLRYVKLSKKTGIKNYEPVKAITLQLKINKNF